MKPSKKYKFYIFSDTNCRIETRTSPDETEFEGLNYLKDPDVTAISKKGVKLHHLKRVGDKVVEMSASEKKLRDEFHDVRSVSSIPERIITKEIKVEVIKEVEKPIERILEKFIYVDKPYPVEVQVEVVKEVLKEIIREVEKPIEKIVEKEKVVYKDKIVNKVPTWCYFTTALLIMNLIYLIIGVFYEGI